MQPSPIAETWSALRPRVRRGRVATVSWLAMACSSLREGPQLGTEDPRDQARPAPSGSEGDAQLGIPRKAPGGLVTRERPEPGKVGGTQGIAGRQPVPLEIRARR